MAKKPAVRKTRRQPPPPQVPGPDRRRLKKGLARGAIVLLGVVAGFALLEWIGPRLAPRYDLSRFVLPDWPQRTGKDFVTYKPSDILPYELGDNPGKVNSLGLWDREYSLRKAPGVFRIVFLGDSITHFSPYTEALENELNESGSGNYEVWNAAVGSYGIREYAALMRYRVPSYDPDLVVLAFCVNDLIENMTILYYDEQGRKQAYKGRPGMPGRLDNFLFKRSFLYRMICSVRESRADFETKRRDRIYWATEAMKTIRSRSENIGVPVVAIVFPVLLPRSEWTEEEKFGFESIVALLEKFDVPFLDLSDTFVPEEKRPQWRSRPGDRLHLNWEANDVLVPALQRFLRDRGLIPPSVGADEAPRR
jgi:lysophospholipase L1-like esterase